jgi:hypothetical protein
MSEQKEYEILLNKIKKKPDHTILMIQVQHEMIEKSIEFLRKLAAYEEFKNTLDVVLRDSFERFSEIKEYHDKKKARLSEKKRKITDLLNETMNELEP